MFRVKGNEIALMVVPAHAHVQYSYCKKLHLWTISTTVHLNCVHMNVHVYMFM